jgi:hypothetical protein
MPTQVAGCPLLEALAPLEISNTTVPRIARPAIQPASPRRATETHVDRTTHRKPIWGVQQDP